MKVIELTAFGGTENFKQVEREIPTVPKGHVRIKLSAAAFNPVDTKRRKGKFDPSCPVVLGSDASGVIDTVGEGVTYFKKGDEVYTFVMGDETAKSSGSYAEYISIDEHLVAHKPKNIDLADAAALPVVALTVYDLIVGRAKIQEGDSVFVAGASGGTGSLAVQLLQHVGASPIIVTAGSDESEEYIHSHFGIPKKNIIRHSNKSVADISSEVHQISGPKGVKFAIDLVGGNMKELCFHVIALWGHILTIVEEDDPKYCTPLYPSQSGPNSLFMKDATFSTIFVGAGCFSQDSSVLQKYRKDLTEISKLFEQGKLKAPRITKGPFSLETIEKAHKQLETGSTKGKLIMTIP
eukprot:TRINITY_DN1612_c0_g1_i1.p1 TRINITY_DN1612_c0_g1~~TRINITY_DN1612_c0_g1_i1.p1  ORF type:complete len:351 (+),score=94.72 TRINITY_DN1612_c0_g1_i1:172-1224(+)